MSNVLTPQEIKKRVDEDPGYFQKVYQDLAATFAEEQVAHGAQRNDEITSFSILAYGVTLSNLSPDEIIRDVKSLVTISYLLGRRDSEVPDQFLNILLVPEDPNAY